MVIHDHQQRFVVRGEHHLDGTEIRQFELWDKADRVVRRLRPVAVRRDRSMPTGLALLAFGIGLVEKPPS
jgi:hypothetical protein